MFFKRLLNCGRNSHSAQNVYELIVAKARQPVFYESLGVADTVDGRFDMITLHAILIMNRLSDGSRTAREFSQKIFDAMFADMDRSLREMGVGDLSVGKNVRGMAEMFYGRAKAYRAALAADSEVALEAAIARNVFPDGGAIENIKVISDYFLRSARLLAQQKEHSLLSGQIGFADVSSRKA